MTAREVQNVGIEEHDKRGEIARKHTERGNHEKALPLLRTNLAWSKSNLGSAHPVTLADQEELAFELNELGLYEEAAALDKDTLRIRKKENVGEHTELLETQHNLAFNFFKLGLHHSAANLDRETLQAREVALGQKHEDTLSSRHNLAASLHELRQYEEAAQLNRRVLEARKSICTETEPDLISSRHNLASNLYDLGRYKQAASLLEENIGVLRGERNRTNPQLLISEKLSECNNRAWSRQKEANAAQKSNGPPSSSNEREARMAERPRPDQIHSNMVKAVERKVSLPGKSVDNNVPTKENFSKGSFPRQQVRLNSDSTAKRAPTPRGGDADAQKVMSDHGKVKQEPASNSKYPTLSPQHAVERPRPRSKSEQDLGKSRGQGDLDVPSDLPTRAASTGPANNTNHKSEEQYRRKSTEGPTAGRKTTTASRFFDAHSGDQDQYLSDAADNWFSILESDTQTLLEPYRRTNVRRVKVAILDTGLDRTHADIGAQWSTRIRDVKNWVHGENGDIDRDGHGTHGAALLMKIAPEAHIFVARVARDTNNLRAENVAKAIMHASDEWKVDIISMSFGFPQYYTSIERAISHAVRQNIIVFAAASNSGANRKIAFPASLSNGVIRINSADGRGAGSRYNPPPLAQEYNFSVLGESVLSAWPTKPGRAVEKRKSGTSTSTPIAAAIAALILEFERQMKKQSPESKVLHRERLQSLEGMRAIFSHMSEPKDGYSYVVPWNLLDSGRGREHVAGQLTEIMYKRFGPDSECP